MTFEDVKIITTTTSASELKDKIVSYTNLGYHVSQFSIGAVHYSLYYSVLMIKD